MFINIMTSCPICTEQIFDDLPVFESPCCKIKYHSKCAIETIHIFYSSYIITEELKCAGCHTSVLPARPTPPEESDNATQSEYDKLIANPEAVKKLKEIKKRGITYNKAKLSFNRMMNEKYKEFMSYAQPHINMIKTYKKKYIDDAKATEECEAFRKACASYKSAKQKFTIAYNVDWMVGRILFGRWNGLRFWRRGTPVKNLEWKFRIRI